MLNFIIKEHRLNIVAHDRERKLNMFFFSFIQGTRSWGKYLEGIFIPRTE